MGVEKGNRTRFSAKDDIVIFFVVLTSILIFISIFTAALRFEQRRMDRNNQKRWSDVNYYLTAIHECVSENDGDASACGLIDDGTTYEIVNGATRTGCDAVCSVAADECVDMSALVAQNYLDSLPAEPLTSADDHTSYSVSYINGVVTVEACAAESEIIKVSR